VLGTIGIPLPLWQTNQTERERAQVDEQVAHSELSASTSGLRARIARAHAELQSAAERLRLTTDLVGPALEQSLTLLGRGFDAGEIPLIDVAVVRERFLQNQRDALQAHLDYYQALVELEDAAGVDLTRLRSGAKGPRR
jgi:outer membrane protein TolC